jgi:hypothetical protein
MSCEVELPVKHVSVALAHARELDEVAHDNSLFARVRELTMDAQRLKVRAERSGDYRTALAAVRELACLVELEARLTGELNERPETKILNVTLDAETARRMTETFLARPGGGNPA